MIDYQTLEDGTVTVRDRDSMKQDRVGEDALTAFLAERSAGACSPSRNEPPTHALVRVDRGCSGA